MITRKSAFDPSARKTHETFRRACEKLIESGEYTKFVNWHTAMGRYRMHSREYEGDVGMWRFLAWHRIYLLRFEAALRQHEPTAYIPYWKWTNNQIPKWITDFKPTVDKVKLLASSHMDLNPKFDPPAPLTVKRRNFLMGAKTTQDYIDHILSTPEFGSFSLKLERGPHDKIHRAFRGTMNSHASPADPLFWLHHANVDRLWAKWQSRNAGKSTPLIQHPDDDASTTEKTAFKQTWSLLEPFNVPIENACRLTTAMGYQYG